MTGSSARVRPAMSVCVSADGFSGTAEDVWLDLTADFSIVTGRNNVGKTRLLRAIAVLCSGRSQELGEENLRRVRVTVDGQLLEAMFDEQGRILWFASTSPDGPPHTWVWGGPQAMNRFVVHAGGEVGPVYGSAPPDVWTPFPEPPPGYPLFKDSLSRIIFFPSERAVRIEVPTQPIFFPNPDGRDLANVIYTHAGNCTDEFREIEEIIRAIFPEVGRILAAPVGENRTRLSVRDRFAVKDLPLNRVGSGLGQILLLVTSVITQPPGRIFLLDEPHAFLHPTAERELVAFLRSHGEHWYVCATHSPVLVNAADADSVWLVTRDQEGIRIQSVFAAGMSRRDVWAEIGIDPGDVAFAERIIFVEGRTEEVVLPDLLLRLGWDLNILNCEIVRIDGVGVVPHLTTIAPRLEEALRTQFLIYLDGDQQQRYGTYSVVQTMPFKTIEEMFLLDADAILLGLLDDFSDTSHPTRAQVEADWTADKVGDFIQKERNRADPPKAADILDRLARSMWGQGGEYSKTRNGPQIARHLREDVIEKLRPSLQDFFT